MTLRDANFEEGIFSSGVNTHLVLGWQPKIVGEWMFISPVIFGNFRGKLTHPHLLFHSNTYHPVTDIKAY